MNEVREEHELARKYLLGGLSDPEGEAFEDRFLADDELFEVVRAAETDLLDEYVRGELEGAERSAFARRLSASPDLEGRLPAALAVAEGLRRPVPRADPPLAPAGGRVYRYLAVAAVVVMGIVGIWLVRDLSLSQEDRERLETENRALRNELHAALSDLVRARRPASVPAPTAGPAAPVSAAPGAAVWLRLAPGLLRDIAGHNDFRVPSAASAALLEIPVEPDPNAPTYTASIETPEGERVIEQRRLAPVVRGKFRYLVVGTSPQSLPAGDYLLKIRPEARTAGASRESSFAFRVSYN